MQANLAQTKNALQLTFNLQQWCFWQSEPIASQQGWPLGTVLPSDFGSPDVQFLPMMQRRRLSPLAKAACAVAWRCRQLYGNLPTVFYSVHGESRFYLDMLRDMAKGEAVSPSRFSLCVHNAIAGLFSFQSQNTQPYVSLAGGSEGMMGAFIEIGGLLLETPQVMLVCYEQALPVEYQNYWPLMDKTWALALVLSRNSEANSCRLHWRRSAKQAVQPIDSDLALAHAIVKGQYHGCLQFPAAEWTWELQNA